MTQNNYEDLIQNLLDTAKQVRTSKQPSYTGNDTDVLKNFKVIATRLGLDPLQVWAIYFNKQVDAVNSIVKNPEIKPSEAPILRYADIINYCFLGLALMNEDIEITSNTSYYVQTDTGI